MAISTSCPNCEAVFRLSEELEGKTVKCKKCGDKFVVPDAGATGVEPGLPVPRPDEVDEPARKSRPARSRKRAYDDDDDDRDRDDRDAEDRDEDEDDEPRRP